MEEMRKIRQATPEDYDAIYELVKVGFQTARVTDGTEQDFVNELRNGPGYREELEFVMEQEGELIGHVMLTKLSLHIQETEVETLLLAPLCVKLEHRNKGIGGVLVNESFQAAKALGYTSVFLVGNPEYYKKFGFRSTVTYGIENQSDIPDEYVLGCELIPDALQGVDGWVQIV